MMGPGMGPGITNGVVLERRGGIGGKAVRGSTIGLPAIPLSDAQAVEAEEGSGVKHDKYYLKIHGGKGYPDTWAAVAGGTYSLPVELPDGQVQLDFASPGGAAKLSITATPENLGKNLWSSAITIIVAALAAGVALLISKRIRKVEHIHVSSKTLVLALLLVCFVTLLTGPLGFIISAAVLGLVRLYRREPLSRSKTGK